MIIDILSAGLPIDYIALDMQHTKGWFSKFVGRRRPHWVYP
jgi:hypothetical protein